MSQRSPAASYATVSHTDVSSASTTRTTHTHAQRRNHAYPRVCSVDVVAPLPMSSGRRATRTPRQHLVGAGAWVAKGRSWLAWSGGLTLWSHQILQHHHHCFTVVSVITATICAITYQCYVSITITRACLGAPLTGVLVVIMAVAMVIADDIQGFGQ